MDIVYVVTADGADPDDYGSEIYLVGVFKYKHSVDALKSKYPDIKLKVTRVEVGKEYPMIPCHTGWGDGYENNKYLGGHTE